MKQDNRRVTYFRLEFVSRSLSYFCSRTAILGFHHYPCTGCEKVGRDGIFLWDIRLKKRKKKK